MIRIFEILISRPALSTLSRTFQLLKVNSNLASCGASQTSHICLTLPSQRQNILTASRISLFALQIIAPLSPLSLLQLLGARLTSLSFLKKINNIYIYYLGVGAQSSGVVSFKVQLCCGTRGRVARSIILTPLPSPAAPLQLRRGEEDD